MRATVTLEPDVATLVQEKMSRTSKTFKEVINTSLRKALRGETSEHPFVVTAQALGLRSGIDPTTSHDLYADLEADQFLRKTKAVETTANCLAAS